MSRSALLVAALLFATGLVAWLAVSGPPPAGPARVPTAAPAPPAGASPAPMAPDPPRPAAPAPVATPAGPARVTTAEEFVAALNAQGRDGPRLLAALREWRASRGYLQADPLTGVTAGVDPASVYAGMDRETLKALADGGDANAMHLYGAASLPAEPAVAIEYLGRASRLGSAAAMIELASALAATDAVAAGRDPGRDAAAWLLAAIRLHGPIVATPAVVARLQGLAADPDPAFLPAACASSLAILADLSATPGGRAAGTLPPAFVTERGLYDRLPCGDTPAPVMPPRDLARCVATPALGAGGRPAELWVCPEA